MALQFPANPTVGQVFTSPQGVSWTFDGQKWACGGGGSGPGPTPTPGGDTVPMNQIVFTASGQYTPSANLVSAIVEICGGGGGGGGLTGNPGAGNACGGGGSGAYTRAVLTAAQIGSGQAVTVGQGGTGVAGGAGNAGGTTTFGTLINAPGGGGGSGTDGGAGAPAMANPPAGVLAVPGGGGQGGTVIVGATTWVTGGIGAGSYFGDDSMAYTPAAGAAQPGNPGAAGSGGSGAAGNQGAATAVPGGNGGNGLCVITEFTSSP